MKRWNKTDYDYFQREKEADWASRGVRFGVSPDLGLHEIKRAYALA